MSHKGGAREHMSDTYRTMVTEEPSLEAFATLIHMLLEENDGAFLWHCTQGKDRTGIASAAVLLALGVDRDEIMRDYMRTNKSCRVKNFFIYLGVILVTLSRRSAWSLHQILISRREYLKAAFEKMDEVLGVIFFGKREDVSIPEDVQKLLEERALARQNKDWARSDYLRDEIAKLGYTVKDSKEGQKCTLKI
jgi:protein-tyrosine phosphatase